MSRRRRKGARLEMTSLMDVMFLVLVFFIYSIFNMTVHRGLKVELPTALGEAEQGERIVVTILSDNAMQFNGIPVTQAEVIERIVELRKLDMKLPVLVSGDRHAALGVGIELLAALKAAGVEGVSFQVSGEEPK